MSPAALSVRIYGSYAALLGLLLVLFPNTLAGWLTLSENPPALRWAGMVLIGLGLLLRQGADHDAPWLLRSSVWIRIAIGIGLAISGVAAGAWNLLFLSAIDLGSALWTRSTSSRHWQ
jgi:uncharacterized membrane protein